MVIKEQKITRRVGIYAHHNKSQYERWATSAHPTGRSFVGWAFMSVTINRNMNGGQQVPTLRGVHL